ncbi:hypothetical protein BV22DRAFT_1034934 [Leucogyrophana mollusca]|uniref:Uncharacterized protein n=1 Tax=Leucogyrophana mollusca TaxID=85980 RepID=A0ACB8BGC5_9AGAM|nr:hypothetical protein BV22DRAFT_1034934 [Leucogyrophana mollusca]
MSTAEAPTPRSARFDLPPAPAFSSTSDSGLAEWTSRIKAMQRQVDADEETEQRRLEEEIARARLARMRRSRTGQSGDFGIGMHGIDLGKLQNETSIGARHADDHSPAASANIEKPLASGSTSSSKPSPPVASKPAPMSLAAFMGGSATGPRLRRHEAQADAGLAYDGRTDRGAVHPIFGRGGVAMPGMVGRGAASGGSAPPAAATGPPTSHTPQPSEFSVTRQRTTSTSSVARRYVEKLEEQKQSQPQNQKPVGLGIRERRVSTPNGEPPAKAHSPAPSRPVSQVLPNEGRWKSTVDHRSKSSTPDPRPETPLIVETRPKTPVGAEIRPKTPLVTEFGSKSPITESRPKTPLGETTRAKTPTRANFSASPSARPWTPQQPPSSTPSPPVKLPALAPSPARPTYSPQPQRGASPAFLRPPSAAKGPTPSISRLQGRGFVQSVVQASGRREADAPSGQGNVRSVFSSPTQGDAKDKTARRASVLDRWQPGAVNNGASASPPPPSPKSFTPSRSRTVGAPQTQDMPVVKSHDTGRSLKSTVSMPSLAKTPLKKPEALPAVANSTDASLGSSSTMISYIKPTKTGDDPVVPDVEEQGNRVDAIAANFEGRSGRSGKEGGSVSSMPSPGKPLSHPTKDRARKPRKGKSSGAEEHTSDELRSPQVSLPSPEPAQPSALPERVQVPAPNITEPPRVSLLGETFPSSLASKSTGEQPSLDTSSSSEQLKVTVTPPGSTGRITDRWTEPTIIGVKAISSSSSTVGKPLPSKSQGIGGMVGRRALPGLAGPIPQVMSVEKEEKPTPKEERVVPPSPTRHGRIPSTGNRALVMDVAQALSQHQATEDTSPSPSPPSPVVPQPDTVTPRPRNVSPGNVQSDKRKSSYERYSSIMMPPLKEERTPVPSPAGTLSRNIAPVAIQTLLGSGEVNESPFGSMRAELAPIPDVVTQTHSETDLVHIDHADEPLPSIDIDSLLQGPSQTFIPSADLRTVSVEVLTITATTASPVQRDSNVFYDSEVLAIVHRSKSRESGLVVTKVWCWRGNQCNFGEREDRKVNDLAKRYGTALVMVNQHCEPAELVHVLGGQLAIRQGSRVHWSSENTAMHVVRLNCGLVIVDEIELNVKNLCSGFSYCLSILNNIYVWQGCGSPPKERQAALEYARGFSAKGTTVIELVEGENDTDDGMFWMILGDGDYAKADYWKWRSSSPSADPRCWVVDVVQVDEPIRSVSPLSSGTLLQGSVYIVDCVWEFFVLVGKEARAQRQNIKLAVQTVMEMSKRVAMSKPFTPTVHVLVFPTQLPLDLRLAFRDFDEAKINGSEVPDHMNILSTTEALDHLRTSSWDKSALKDHTMLPLGLDSSHIPL